MKIPSRSRSFSTTTCSIEGCENKNVIELGKCLDIDDESSKWLTVGTLSYGERFIFCPIHAKPIKDILGTL